MPTLSWDDDNFLEGTTAWDGQGDRAGCSPDEEGGDLEHREIRALPITTGRRIERILTQQEIHSTLLH